MKTGHRRTPTPFGEETTRAGAVLGIVLLAAVVLIGCARQARVESGPGATAPDTLAGTVRQVGNTPFVRTVVQAEEEEEGAATVTGSLEEELSRLVGARVRIVGDYREGDGPWREMEVADYEILSVDGEEPLVGTLRQDAERGYYLETEDDGEVALAGVSERLAGQVGARVWVVVGEGGGVQRYGILREP